MRFRRLVTAAAILAGVVILPAAASAANGFTTGNVNVRAGPGTGYDRIGMLLAGTPVDIRSCQDNWCNIRGDRLRGWVSANFLSRANYRPPVVVVPPPIFVRPPNYRPPHWNRPPPHWNRPPPSWHRPPNPRPPRPRPPGANCKIAPGFPCPR